MLHNLYIKDNSKCFITFIQGNVTDIGVQGNI